MTIYQWQFEILHCPENREPEIVRAGAVTTRQPSRRAAIVNIHRQIHVRDFFRLRVEMKPKEVRV